MNGGTWRSRRRRPSMRLMAFAAGAVATAVLLVLFFTSEGTRHVDPEPDVELHWPEKNAAPATTSSADAAGRLAVQLAGAAEPPAASADLYLPSDSHVVDLDGPFFQESTDNAADDFPEQEWNAIDAGGDPWDSFSEDVGPRQAWVADGYKLAENGELASGEHGEVGEKEELGEEVEDGHLLLLHQGRCGSTVLMSLMRQRINRHAIVFSSWNEFMTQPGVSKAYAGEEWNEEWLTQFVKGKTEAAANGVTKNLILSLKFAHICRLGVPAHAILAAAYEAGFRHLVVLHRNYLKVALSMAHVKQAHASYHAGSAQMESCSDLSLRVGGVTGVPAGRGALQDSCGREKGEEPLLGSFEVLDKGYLAALQSPFFRDSLLLSYEKDIYEDPRVAYGKVRQYLQRRGVDLAPVEELEDVSLAKTTDCSIEEVMDPADYAAVSSRLAETKWAWTLLDVQELQELPGFPHSVIYDVKAAPEFY